MSDPIISWEIKKGSETDYTNDSNYYGGYILSGESFIIDMRIWNNKYGTEQVNSLTNFNIAVSFSYLEDAAILDYCSFYLNSSEKLETSILDKTAVVVMPDGYILYGYVNDGSDNYEDNYLSLKLIIEIPTEANIKINDMKTMNLSIVKI
jgi:hypothetical protein